MNGWFGRNWWGLLALIPVIAIFGIVHIGRLPALPASASVTLADADGWATYGGARIRLTEVAPAKDVRDTAGKFLKLPDGIVAWRAVLEFETSDQSGLLACSLSLEDSLGRVYQPSPRELGPARIPVPGCTAEDRSLSRYQSFAYFATPVNSEPAAIRVYRQATAPAYARLLVAH